jgi:hypothetical protein
MNNLPRLSLLAVPLLLSVLSTSADAAGVSGQGTWETTLQPRDLDGNLSTAEAYYDTALYITWLADANYAGTADDTRMDWTTANNWAANLNIHGITGWRLPTVTDTGTPGCDFYYAGTDCGYNVDTATSEMAHMFYVTLGNTAYCDTSGNCPQAGYGLSNTGPFSNIQRNYWSATELATNLDWAWGDSFNDGLPGKQDVGPKSYGSYAWAVHSGDVGTPIPVPIIIDIKPGSDTNSINISSSGVIPVAIISTKDFDAATVEPSTVSLAGASVKMVGKSDKYSCDQEDVNNDGLMDLVCHVYTAQFMIESGQSTAVLEAKTFDGTNLRGEDIINVVPDN